MKENAFKHFKLLFTAPFLVHLFLASASALPCKGQLVNTGELMNEVTAKCGEAIAKEQRTVKVEDTDRDGVTRSTVTTIDEWIYGSGPNELVQSYRFEDGKLTAIKNIGYGTGSDLSIDTCRNGAALAIGDSTDETYLKCGQPTAKEKRDDRILETESPERKTRIYIPVVDWTYRYGPDLPGYTVTFENGVAARIRTREFGK